MLISILLQAIGLIDSGGQIPLAQRQHQPMFSKRLSACTCTFLSTFSNPMRKSACSCTFFECSACTCMQQLDTVDGLSRGSRGMCSRQKTGVVAEYQNTQQAENVDRAKEGCATRMAITTQRWLSDMGLKPFAVTILYEGFVPDFIYEINVNSSEWLPVQVVIVGGHRKSSQNKRKVTNLLRRVVSKSKIFFRG